MTAQKLLDTLQELIEDHGPDVEVRIASQPSWPFEYAVGQVVAVANGDDDDDDDDESSPEVVFFIGEGRQIGYLGGAAVAELGWQR